MFSFTSYNYEGKVRFKKTGKEYLSGEILTHYLNLDVSKIQKAYQNLCRLKTKCLYPLAESDADGYNLNVNKAQSNMSYIFEFVSKQPPYCHLKGFETIPNALFIILNEMPWLFEDNDEFDHDEWRDEETEEMFDVGEYGYRDIKSGEHELFKFIPEVESLTYLEDAPFQAEELNRKIAWLFDRYIDLAAGICRVTNVFTLFLDTIVHASPKKDLFENLDNFLKEHSTGINPILSFSDAKNINISYSVITDTKKILCKLSEFNSIGDFLYIELLEGIISGQLPKRCKNCGKYFLLSTGHSTEYCDNIAPGETERTCKEVGAKNSFDDKVKANPVWLEHQRAYKAHYARVLKKKMTKEEFFNWSEYAAELRDKALNGEINFEEYIKQIKK